MKAKRTTVFFTNAAGRKLALVPLAENQGNVTIDAADLERILALGISPHWQAIRGRAGTGLYVRAYFRGSRRRVPVARYVAEAGHGQVVSFKDGDRFNFRRENLVLSNGPARSKCSDAEVRFELHKVEKAARSASTRRTKTASSRPPRASKLRTRKGDSA